MRALALTTRFRDGAFEGDACLLVYDLTELTGSIIGDDVRDILDRRPNTPRIFVLAPFLPFDHVAAALKSSAGLQRVGAVAGAGELGVIGLRVDEHGNCLVFSKAFTLLEGISNGGEPTPLAPELRQGWLFDIFDTNHGRVDAPAGVHFGKASDKHADKFLRTSSILLSTAACALVGFFALAAVRPQVPRRIFVDTAPLLSVAFAMQRVAETMNLWHRMPPAKSFSSYGGVDKLPNLARGDLVLVSASTSGGLARRLVAAGAPDDSLVTLFMLRSNLNADSPGTVLCDLTYWPGRTFGYPPVQNYAAATCELCRKGYVLAELEGDQFLLERRAVKRLRISTASQTPEAKAAAELLSRREVLAVNLHGQDTRRTDIDLDLQKLLAEENHASNSVKRLLSRHTPVPLNYVVLVGLPIESFSALAASSGIDILSNNAAVVMGDAVGQLSPIVGGNALVIVGVLDDHSVLRGINAQLRSKVPGGCVAYISAVTVADSARNLADLRIFLSYGEHGPETFTFRSALELMLPWTGERPSSWSLELELLRRLSAEGPMPVVLVERKNWLESNARSSNFLFFPGVTSELTLARDFVFLDTKSDLNLVSQADIYAVVSNLLATIRCDNKGINEPLRRDSPPLTWGQSVYGQVVLCPSNFRDYNDAVLQASMLRAANHAELNYSVDEQCSSEMLDILLAEVDSWKNGRGDSLPEFLLALATCRLRLIRGHLERFLTAVATSDLPEHLKILANAVPRD